MLSLFGGITLGAFIFNDFSLFASIETLFKLFFSLLLEAWILKTLAFAVLVGSIMALIEKSGGIEGFVDFMQHKVGLVKSPRAALMLSYFIGVVIFVESSITSLIAGAVGKPFCDKYKIPSAKLAFVCDSTSAPISSLIILNGWGALLLGLVATQISLGVMDANAIDILIDAIFYNFYSMAALAVTFLFIWFNIDIGAMKKARYTARNSDITSNGASMFYMLLPIALMVLLVFVFLYITGGGDILKGSGSSSIFYTMLTVLLFTLFYFVGTKNMSLTLWSKTALEGAWKLVPIALILLFAFAIGEMTTELKTGHYLASLATQNLSVTLLAGVHISHRFCYLFFYGDELGDI